MHADAVLRTYCKVDVYPVSTLSATVRNVLTKRDSVTTTQKRIQEERWFKTKIQYVYDVSRTLPLDWIRLPT